MRDERGAVTGLLGIFWDITERQQNEVKLRESELLFHTLTDAMPQMVWMCTPDGLSIYFNQQWVDYTGLTLEESYGRGWNTPFHPDDKQSARDAWKHVRFGPVKCIASKPASGPRTAATAGSS